MSITKKEREKLVLKYFTITPKKPKYGGSYFWFIVGVGLILFFLGNVELQREPVGMVMIVAGAIILLLTFLKFNGKKSSYKKAYNLAEPKATDEQMDEWLKEGRDMICKTAMERLDIDDEDSKSIPLTIDGPVKQFTIKPGKDKILRFVKHDMLLLFLTDHNVSTFKCIYDLALGEILEDRTKEFPYKDITNLETETATDTFYYQNDTKTKIEGIKSFSLFTSGGNKITTNYFFIKNTGEDHEGYRFPPNDDENVIKAIRKKLKDYKERKRKEEEGH